MAWYVEGFEAEDIAASAGTHLQVVSYMCDVVRCGAFTWIAALFVSRNWD